MASGVFPENLRKFEQETNVLQSNKVCENELYVERFHGNGLKYLNSAVILKITPPKKKFGLEDGIKSLSWKFELNRTRNRFFKKFGKKILNALYF